MHLSIACAGSRSRNQLICFCTRIKKGEKDKQTNRKEERKREGENEEERKTERERERKQERNPVLLEKAKLGKSKKKNSVVRLATFFFHLGRRQREKFVVKKK